MSATFSFITYCLKLSRKKKNGRKVAISRSCLTRMPQKNSFLNAQEKSEQYIVTYETNGILIYTS